ncbi:MAG: type II toxin-antitoxin system HicA family toxin [Bacteroidales bacterium]|nr:type II toxin-antitoxin system HicA family toxin [Bacteroidales bacterium]
MDGICIGPRNIIHTYRHPTKPGQLTISKNLSKEVPTGTLNSLLKAAGLK